jgi:hypothetical protein
MQQVSPSRSSANHPSAARARKSGLSGAATLIALLSALSSAACQKECPPSTATQPVCPPTTTPQTTCPDCDSGPGATCRSFGSSTITKDSTNSSWRVNQCCVRTDNNPDTFHNLAETTTQWKCP